MASSDGLPTPEAAAVALAEAEDSRTMVARGVVLPSWFYGAIGAAITVQIAATALGLADIGGVAVAGGCAGVRAGGGHRIGPFPAGERGGAGRVREPGGRRHRDRRVQVLCVVPGRGGVGGVRPGMVAGGALRGRRRVAYAGSGRRWLRTYRAEPAAHGRGQSAAVLAVAGDPRGRRPAAGRAVMPELDVSIQPPVRLRLMTTLTAVSEAEFATLRDTLQVSDSVLSKHVAALVAIGYVNSRKGIHAGRRTTWISLTAAGRTALSTHVAALRELIAGVE